MEVKTKFINLSNDILGDSNVFKLSSAESYKKYDEIAKKTTDEIEGTKFKVLLNIPEKEIYDEKLEVKIEGLNPIPQYKSGTTAFCRFTNLKLYISTIEYGKATIRGVADSIQLVSASDNEQIKGQLKLNLKQ